MTRLIPALRKLKQNGDSKLEVSLAYIWVLGQPQKYVKTLLKEEKEGREREEEERKNRVQEGGGERVEDGGKHFTLS